jgi:N-acetylglutamate synthase-like GNAT family acetyltransferase
VRFHLRPLRTSDVPAILELIKVSLAEESAVEGITAEGFAAQIQLLTRGRMLPMKTLTALLGIQWEVWVAEQDGRVVGCGAFSGRKRADLHTLMVAPAYRRQGIGQALLQKRLERIAARGYPCTTVAALDTNVASLGNLAKQNFEVAYHYTLYEHPLPLFAACPKLDHQLISRPVRRSDKGLIAALEQSISSPIKLQISDSVVAGYLPSLWSDLFDRLQKAGSWVQAFEYGGRVVGFLAASIAHGQEKGFISTPLVADADLHVLDAMMYQATTWLVQHKKSAVQIGLPDYRPLLQQKVETEGWARCLTWVYLVKWLKPLAQSLRKKSVQI